MTHPLDRDFATDTAYAVLQKRRRTGELTTPPLHQPDRRLQSALGTTRSEILRECLTGEPEPLVYEHGSALRHGS